MQFYIIHLKIEQIKRKPICRTFMKDIWDRITNLENFNLEGKKFNGFQGLASNMTLHYQYKTTQSVSINNLSRNVPNGSNFHRTRSAENY